MHIFSKLVDDYRNLKKYVTSARAETESLEIQLAECQASYAQQRAHHQEEISKLQNGARHSRTRYDELERLKNSNQVPGREPEEPGDGHEDKQETSLLEQVGRLRKENNDLSDTLRTQAKGQVLIPFDQHDQFIDGINRFFANLGITSDTGNVTELLHSLDREFADVVNQSDTQRFARFARLEVEIVRLKLELREASQKQKNTREDIAEELRVANEKEWERQRDSLTQTWRINRRGIYNMLWSARNGLIALARRTNEHDFRETIEQILHDHLNPARVPYCRVMPGRAL
ncbi:hypothetical protein F5Y15DRAFT_394238 [Xylariaceae sp. FL0016]|nr:hypothetical protein F5Y15DRAFT_394238 [Xylariaceae sp. FL0016]